MPAPVTSNCSKVNPMRLATIWRNVPALPARRAGRKNRAALRRLVRRPIELRAAKARFQRLNGNLRHRLQDWTECVLLNYEFSSGSRLAGALAIAPADR